VATARGQLEARFRALYDRTYDRLFAFVLRRLPSEHEAKDVVGETYMAVWRRIRDVPREPDEADAWVFGTARRVLANHWRSLSRRDRLSQRLELAHAPRDRGEDDDFELLTSALDRVRDGEREVLQLAVWDEFSHAEIGRILGCSENAVAIRLHRARTALRARYDELAEGRGSS